METTHNAQSRSEKSDLNHWQILFWYQKSIRQKSACIFIWKKYAYSLTNTICRLDRNDYFMTGTMNEIRQVCCPSDLEGQYPGMSFWYRKDRTRRNAIKKKYKSENEYKSE